MAEIRAQIAYHFKLDPAQLTPGRVQLPEMITRTISVGEDIVPEKVASSALSLTDRAALVVEIDKQVREATRTARPAGSVRPEDGQDWEEKQAEMSAF